MNWKTEVWSQSSQRNKSNKQNRKPWEEASGKEPSMILSNPESGGIQISLAYLKVEHSYKTFPKMKWQGKNLLP